MPAPSGSGREGQRGLRCRSTIRSSCDRGGAMRRPSIVLAGIAIALLAILPLVAAPAGAAVTATGVPTSVAACRHGGWRTVSDPTGAPFGSRAACIRWATAHPGGALTLADVGGAFSGTESFTFECT